MHEKVIISLGGSLIVPGEVDAHYVRDFSNCIRRNLRTHAFYIIAGGGKTARKYIDAADLACDSLTEEDKDWIGIHATRLNAHFLRTVFRDIAKPEIVTDPREKSTDYLVTIGAGYRPGNSTDYIAVEIAKTNECKQVINLSNTDYAYDKDPRQYNDAKPIEVTTWREFRKIVGDRWVPGLNTPFDPIASKSAEEAGLTVIIANGKDLSNLEAILTKKPYKGTTIKPNE